MAKRIAKSPSISVESRSPSKNMFCKRAHLSNEAAVENWFVDPLLRHLGYGPDDLLLKTSIRELKVGRGSRSSLYKPDYIVKLNSFPILIIDAKAPTEDIDNWVEQCGSYCLETNKLYEHNPVEYYLLTNGLSTKLYKWDRGKPLLELQFSDFESSNAAFLALEELISKASLKALSKQKRDELREADFELEPVSLDEISSIFYRLHDYMREKEKKTPAAAFMELMKIVFVKIKKDRDLRELIGRDTVPKVKDVIFSVAWIQSQTENENPINDPLFKNLIRALEGEIRAKNKRRIFDEDEEINLSPSTILKIVKDLEHIDFFRMDEDIHGRMFESFLDATVRGQELGQFFTPRDIVKLIVRLADIQVTKDRVESVLDACCGSGGFLISAMADMLVKANEIAGLSSAEKRRLEKKIRNDSLIGIDAGAEPPIHKIARMNMYLHGDGGSNIYFADALDKRVALVGKGDLEIRDEIKELRQMLITEERKFDVILSNPPFSLRYARDTREHQEILNQYELGGTEQGEKSLLSSVMFLERYHELVSEDGRIFAIVDESILSGESYSDIRDFIREKFVILGIVSLPGDAFRRAEARVKTSILILRPRGTDEEQGDVFMEQSVYQGLSTKTAKRIGISRRELEQEKPLEIDRIVDNFKKFRAGKRGHYVVPSSRIRARLDVKYCLGEVGRRRSLWRSKGITVDVLENHLTEASDRETVVDSGTEYILLKVNYDGEVLEAERKFGEECSYRTLYKVKPWDILSSNMGIGRGAIGIVPEFLSDMFVSNEYTILTAKNKDDAVYYTSILRTKEILGDILASTTGMNRGRLRWNDMRIIEVPTRDISDRAIRAAVTALESEWKARTAHMELHSKYIKRLAVELKLDGADSRLRWLAYKPPE